MVMLPRGIALDGGWYRDAAVRPLRGEDEAFLLEDGAALAPAARATALLARCLERLGPRTRPTPEVVRALSVGDREALLLHLRRVTFGNRLSCVLACPAPHCGESMDLDLQITSLLLPPYAEQAAVFEVTVPGGPAGAPLHVRFRLPTGADLEALASIAERDGLDRAAEMLVSRCVESVTDAAGEPWEADLPATVVEAVSSHMAATDPQAETLLELTCPACQQRFVAALDAGAFLCREVASPGADSIYREVHTLASAYHWSEAEILGLSTPKRRRYLDLLAERAA